MVEIKRKTELMLALEVEHSMKIEALLHKLYVLDDMKMNDVCAILNIPRKTLIEWMKKCNLFSHQLTSIQRCVKNDTKQE